MFRTMRRKDRIMDQNKTSDLIVNGEYGVVSTLGDDGYTYGVPVSYVFKNDAIYFHSATTGHKLDNLKSHDKVSFTVVDHTEVIPSEFSTYYQSVIAFGKASICEENEKEEALVWILQKYSPDFIEWGKEYIKKAAKNTVIVKIDIEHMTGKGKVKKDHE